VGGFSAQVFMVLSHTGLLDTGLKIRPLVIPDKLIDHDTQHRQLEEAGLSAQHIVNQVFMALGQELPVYAFNVA